MKVKEAKRKVASTEMEACKVEACASKAKREFQQQKEHADIAMDDAKCLIRKLDKARKGLASMRKRMTDAHQQEIQITEKVKVEIASLKESLKVETKDMREDACA